MSFKVPQTRKSVWLSSLFALAMLVGAAGGYVAWLRVSAPEAGAAIVNGQNASNVLGQTDGSLPTPGPVYTKADTHDAPNRLGMQNPADVVVDSTNHRLFVLENSNNSRVLVYNLNASDALLDRIPDNVIGQANFYSSGAATTQSGLNYPSFAAYDGTNNRLFVSDYGHRVLVYDVSTITDGEAATGVLGQSTFTAGSPSTSQSGMNSPRGLAYDASGSRLFVAQDGAHRVTVYDVASVTNGENATGVLGQSTFTGSSPGTFQSTMNSPYEIAYDSANTRLFVADLANNRVTTYDVATVTNGENAVNVLGQGDFTTATATTNQTRMNGPYGVAWDASGSRLFVAQGTSNRVTVYDLTSISDGEAATGVLGQSDFTSGGTAATQAGLNLPVGLAYVSAASRLYVSDMSNNRVVAYDVTSVTNGENAVDALGQTDGSVSAPSPVYTKKTAHDAPNRLGYGTSGATDVELDTTAHRMFVADYSNNRVLVYNLDSNDDLLDRVPDNVLGQPNFYTGTSAFTQAGMYDPSGLAYDATNSRLFVGQTSRVTAYDVAAITDGENATGVLGQSTFTGSTQATTQAGMNNPFAVAYDSANSLLFVGDFTNKRVTTYNLADGLTDGENATKVLGQANFTSSTAATTQAGLNLIRDIAYDSANSRLYVADGSNNRVIVYDVASISNGENAYRVLGQPDFTSSGFAATQNGMSGPRGVAFDAVGSRLFVGDDSNNRILAFDVATITDGEDATHVLGQTTFSGSSSGTTQAKLYRPYGLAFDSGNGRLWATDAQNRRLLSYDVADLAMSSAATGDDDTDGKIDRIVVTFNQDLDASTVTGADFSVTSPSYTVSSASETSAGVVTIVLAEGGSADSAATPTVNIVGSVQNNGNTETATSGSELATDGAAPVVMSVSPADSATGVAVNADLVITFSEAMDTGFAEGTEFSVSPDPGSFSAAWSGGNTIVTLSHSSSHFAASTSVTVTTAEAQIAAAAGSPSALVTTGPQDGDWSFTTGATATCPFVDNDGNDGNGATGTYQLNANYSVPASTGAYDCTSPATFVIPTAKTLTLQGNTATGAIARMNFTNLTVDSGGTISADSYGCNNAGGNNSPGYGPNGSNACVVSTSGYGGYSLNGGGGGGYGGSGGANVVGTAAGDVYGSATSPAFFGSSGGKDITVSAGIGGGVIRLDVTGTFTHNGSLTADGSAGTGGTYPSGGGSGGSIYVTTGSLNGTTGTYSADGGDGGDGTGSDEAGGGGGGRISVSYAGGSVIFDSSDFTVAGGAAGDGAAAGSGAPGDKGTVYVVNTQGTGPATDDEVTIYHGFTYQDIDHSVGYWIVDTSATNQYCGSSAVSPSITAGTVKIGGTLSCGPNTDSGKNATGLTSFDLSASTSFEALASTSWSVTTENADMDWNIPAGDTQNWNDVTVTGAREGDFTINDAVAITLTGSSAVYANAVWTSLTSLTIDSGSSIDADTLGCASSGGDNTNGYGPNGSNVCVVTTAGYGGASLSGGGGAGYGGAGGTNVAGTDSGTVYGSATAPTLYGSSGGKDIGSVAGTGGGAIRLDVSGTFTFNGSLTADGSAGAGGTYPGGAGSGGSIYVTTGSLDGATGTFSADGGDGGDGTGSDEGGGGGGGRIAITRTGGSYSADSGDFTVSGGAAGDGAAAGSGAPGEKGTVYMRNTTSSRVDIFHGFAYPDTDFSETTWNVDSSATNQYCTSAAVSPSVTATTLNWAGTLACGTSSSSGKNAAGLTSFNLDGNTDFNVASSTSFAVTATGADIDWDIPAGDSQTWTGVTVTGPAQGDFTINDAVVITLSGTTAINANAIWTALTDLTIGSSASIAAGGASTARGCVENGSNDGYAPDGSNACAIDATGAAGGGQGSSSASVGAGGGGHGGSGGQGSTAGANGTGGSTYDSVSSPARYGASGGQGNSGNGGTGGGYVRLDVSGTLTDDGTVSAVGGAGATGGTGAGGGGAGGSVYVSAGTMSCTAAPSFSVAGGAGGDGSTGDGGGGGGGILAIEYTSAAGACGFDSGADTIGGSGASVLAAGGSGPGTAADGSTGTVAITQLDDPPAVSVAVAASPSAPNVTQDVTISATFTDDNGVNQIKLFKDGTADPANVIKTCTFSPAQSPATCSETVGPQSDGSHSIRATGRDTISQTTNSDSSFTVGSFTTSGTMTLSRLKAGLAGVDFALQFALTGPDTGALTVTFPAGFTVTQAFTSGTCSGGGTVGSFGYTSTTLTGTKTGCIGTVTLSGAKITNHATPGTYTVTWANDSGSGSFTVVDDDQVMVSGQVDASLTFDLDVAVADASSAAPYLLDFGEITPGTVASSGTAYESIWLDLSTNATGGAVVTVRNANGSDGLVSSSVPADKITNSAAAMSSASANYGICVISVAQAAGGPLAKAGNYTAGTCAADGATNDVKALTTSNASILSTGSDPVDSGRARVSVNVNAVSTTPAHPDYSDALTFIATATY